MGIVTRLPLRQAGDSVYLYMMIVISILAAVIQMAAYFEEAYRNESMSNWYQSNG